MFKYLLLAGCLFVSTSGFCLEKFAALDRIVQAYTRSWNEQGCKGFADDFTEDADWVNIFAMKFKGKKQIEERHIMLLKTFFKDSKLRILNTSYREVKPGVVIGLVEWELDGYRDPGSDNTQPGSIRTGVYTQVFLQEGDKWVVTSSHNAISPQRKSSVRISPAS